MKKKIDLNYKPNALDKARFEFSPLGQTFNTGLDKNAHQEEGIIKLLKDIRDGLAGNVIIPARPPRPNDNENFDNGNDDNGNDDNGNDDNGNDDNGNDDNGNDDNGNDLSWMNDLQLYKKIALEVFSRYNGDKNSFELFTLQTFIDNINNKRVKNKKDAREEFKNVKKNVKSEALKEIVKDLEQAIFGDDDNDESLIEGLDKDILEQEELDRRFKNLISKKRRESLRECLKESKNVNPQDRVNALKEYLKESTDANLQDRTNVLKKKLNKSFKKISKDNDDNDDSEDNKFSNFVDEVLKNITEQKKPKDFENLFNKNIKEFLELDKIYMESRARTDETINDREEVSKNDDKALKKYYQDEAKIASEKIEKYNKIINNNLDMSSEKSEIINKLIELYSLKNIYNLNQLDNNLKENENINIIPIRDDIIELEKKLRELSKKGWGVFTSQKEFAKLLTFLAQLLTNNTAELTARSSKKLISDIEQLKNNLYNNKQITKQVYNNLIKAITYK